MKFEPEFEAKRVEWLQRFSDALEELRRTYASKMSLMIDRVLDIANKGRASKGTEEKCDSPTEVKFFGMTLGASREDTAARLAEMGFALAPAKGRSKNRLTASAEGEPASFAIEFKRDKLIRVLFRFSYPPRTHSLKTGDLEKIAFKKLGPGKWEAHSDRAKECGVKGIWDGDGMTDEVFVAMWRERDEDAKIHTICFEICGPEADLPPVIDKFLNDQEIEIERMMAKEYGTDDFDE